VVGTKPLSTSSVLFLIAPMMTRSTPPQPHFEASCVASHGTPDKSGRIDLSKERYVRPIREFGNSNSGVMIERVFCVSGFRSRTPPEGDCRPRKQSGWTTIKGL